MSDTPTLPSTPASLMTAGAGTIFVLAGGVEVSASIPLGVALMTLGMSALSLGVFQLGFRRAYVLGGPPPDRPLGSSRG